MKEEYRNPVLILLAAFALALMFNLTIGTPPALAQGILVGTFVGIMIAGVGGAKQRVGGTFIAIAFPWLAMLIAILWDEQQTALAVNPVFYLAIAGFMLGWWLGFLTCSRNFPEDRSRRVPTEIVAAVPAATSNDTKAMPDPTAVAETNKDDIMKDFQDIVPQR